MKRILTLLLIFPLLLTACGNLIEDNVIILATTTSTQDSGLLDVLIPIFETENGYTVKTIAVGTGKALSMGENGDADVLLVHAPDAEMAVMESGSGLDRFLVMHNDFVIVGPASDPANLRGMTSASAAFIRIAESSAPFVSRGDDSGTDKKERAIWESVGVTPAWDGYIESGQGMGATLLVASEKSAYTLTDRATYLAYQDKVALDIMVEGDEVFMNIYHVITINPEKWPEVNYKGALAFANFLVAPSTQGIISTFGVDEYGQPLFFPDAE
ncbi:MAG: tungsten ABC transporter substrate-binding protein [Chloroflexi bacterium]|nr:tungsten ABC transporter substrate-binding protein [Chloroflexota bacterium]